MGGAQDHSKRRRVRRAPFAQPVGSFAARSLEPAARARGFAALGLLQEWASIVGADLASFTMPDRIIWPRRPEQDDAGPEGDDHGKPRTKRPAGATLVLRVDGPRAIEVQYRAQQIMERVNGYFGYRAVVEMRITQAPIVKPAPRLRELGPLTPDPSVLPASASIAAAPLREALIRLGTAIRRRR